MPARPPSANSGRGGPRGAFLGTPRDQHPFFFGFLQQSASFFAPATFSLAALASSLALALRGVSHSFFSLPFMSLQLDRSALPAVLAAAFASSSAFTFSPQS